MKRFIATSLMAMLALVCLTTATHAQQQQIQPFVQPQGQSLGIYSTFIRMRGGFYQSGERVDSVNWGSPAQRAGLERGDVIVECGGYRIENPQSLGWALQNAYGSTWLRVINVRDGRLVTVQVYFDGSGSRPNFHSPGHGGGGGGGGQVGWPGHGGGGGGGHHGGDCNGGSRPQYNSGR